MRLGVLPMLVVMPLLLAACGDGDESNDKPLFPQTGGDDTGVQVYDQAALEGPHGVEKILVEDYKVENIELVDCPADQEVTVGGQVHVHGHGRWRRPEGAHRADHRH